MTDKPSDIDAVPGDPLTEQEIRRLRRLLQSDDRVRWFWASMRTFALWIAAVTAGAYAAQDFAAKLVRSLIGIKGG